MNLHIVNSLWESPHHPIQLYLYPSFYIFNLFLIKLNYIEFIISQIPKSTPLEYLSALQSHQIYVRFSMSEKENENEN